MTGPSQGPSLGAVVAGRYRVVSVLKRGVTSDTYLAEDTRLKRRCAFAVLHEHSARDRAGVERFLRQVRTLAQLEHPNIVDLSAYGAEPGGAVFAAMVLPPGGEGLDACIEAGDARPYTTHDACVWAVQAARAIAVVHDAGFIHRDLRPASVFLADRRVGGGLVKLLDLDLADVAGASEPAAAVASPGTPSYVSPERLENRAADHRADIYSFGVLLYELFTRRRPFTGAALEVAAQHLTAHPEAPSLVAPQAGISRALDRIILTALAKRPDDRFQSMQAVEAALAAVVEESASMLTLATPPGRPITVTDDTAPPEVVSLVGDPPPSSSGANDALGRLRRWAGSLGQRGAFGTLRLGVSAPRRVRRHEPFSVLFVAYPPQQERIARLQLQLPDRTRTAAFDAAGDWPNGTAVEVVLSGEHLEPRSSAAHFVWNGEVQPLKFAVKIRPDAPADLSRCEARLEVIIAGLVVSRLRFGLKIRGTGLLVRILEWLLSRLRPVQVIRSAPCRSAFASYARGDVAAVMQRIDAIEQFTGIRFWVDCLAMDDHGARKPELRQQIAERDAFVLFWSHAAARSAATTWEWRTALTSKGIEGMQAQVLSIDGDPPLPGELVALAPDRGQEKGAVRLALRTRVQTRSGAPALEQSCRAVVSDLLHRALDEAELREFMDLPGSPELIHRLPGPGTSLRQLAWEAGGILERDGLLEDALRRLADRKPNFAPEIWAVLDRLA